MTRDQLYTLLLNLISKTSPHPSERKIIEPYLPKGGNWDKANNYIYTIGNSETLFACHIDTVGRIPQFTHPVYQNSFLFSGNNTDCLGGDDRCGVFCLLALIDAKIPGTYIFHNCEERGAVGASFISKNYNLEKFKRAIEFDRRGIDSLITTMSFDEVCSSQFADALISELNLDYKKDPTGSFTDVYQYIDVIPEVTNLSVGYFNEHSHKECIAALWLIDYFIPSILQVNWENLPVVRDPNVRHRTYDRYYRTRKNTYVDDYDDYDDWNSLLEKDKSAWDDFLKKNKQENESEVVEGSIICSCSSCENEFGDYFKGTSDDGTDYYFCKRCEEAFQEELLLMEEYCWKFDEEKEENLYA